MNIQQNTGAHGNLYSDLTLDGTTAYWYQIHGTQPQSTWAHMLSPGEHVSRESEPGYVEPQQVNWVPPSTPTTPIDTCAVIECTPQHPQIPDADIPEPSTAVLFGLSMLFIVVIHLIAKRLKSEPQDKPNSPHKWE